jgi:protein-S-isoprenylcysteine O-methyltransferase Ste14
MDKFYAIWIALWVLFYGIHSGLAAQKAKNWSQRHLGKAHYYYRVFYNSFHLLAGIGIWWFGLRQTTEFFFEPNNYVIAVGIGLTFFGVLIGISALRTLDSEEFLFGKKKSEQPKWVESGWYARVRHPLYLGVILILFGCVLFWPSNKMMLFTGVTFLYLPFGIYWEEQKLIKTFGSVYHAYKRRTPAIIPFLWF